MDPQELILAYGLLGEFWVDAGRPEKEQLLDAIAAAAWMTLAEIMRLSLRKSAGDVMLATMPPTLAAARIMASGCACRIQLSTVFLPREVELLAGGGDEGAILASEAVASSRADHAAVAGNPNSLASQAVDRGRLRHKANL